MERIKEALGKAREQREEGVNGTQSSPLPAVASGSRLSDDRVLEREPFRRFSATRQRRLLETGHLLKLGTGEPLPFAGDGEVYYLLSGTVVLGLGDDARTVSADEDVALPLDMAGVKTSTITAACDAAVFRIPYAVLSATDELAGEVPLPASAYTETYSGQQLANLVEQITAEHEVFERPGEGVSLVDPPNLSEDDGSATGVGELSESVETLLADLGLGGGEPAPEALEHSYVPQVDDELGRFARDLELRFRRYVEKVKGDERTRYEEHLQKAAMHLQGLAEQQIRTKLSTLNERYRNAYVDKESRLRDRYNKLRIFANKVAHQKAAIYAARQQIGEKLQLVEQVNRELSQLGRQLNHQLDDLDDSMPGDLVQESTGADSDTETVRE